MNKSTLIIVICIIGAIALSGCCSSTDYEDGSTSSGGKLEILSHELKNCDRLGDWHSCDVEGSAKNTGSSRISYASIDVKCYDADGTLLDNGIDSISDLDAGETWKFSAYCSSDVGVIDNYKIGVGSAF